jgi:prevent-host-death family protein
MFTTKGVQAIATITELRSKTSNLIERTKEYEGIMIQKNNEPYAVLLSYDKYLELIGDRKKK